VQAQEVVSALKRIAAEPVQIETAAAGHQNALPRPPAVVYALEVVPPPSVLVDLIERPERGGRQLPAQDALAMFGDVPTQVPASAPGKTEGQRRLADLSRACHEHHLAVEVGAHLRSEIAGLDGHDASVAKIFAIRQKHSR
jgi:hypothetical protein